MAAYVTLHDTNDARILQTVWIWMYEAKLYKYITSM